MKHGSLFSGIGGFDIAAEWMGWENVFHCEWNEFGQKVLKHYWPNALSYEDITKTDFSVHRGTIDILTGGFPCQPYSQAGKRLGKEDDRHLWPEMLRSIREISPRWVVGENVRGLTNWNGGLVFDEVQADLESEGYEVTPFLLPAVAVNAPHRRDRIWFVAYSDGLRGLQKHELQQSELCEQFSKERITTNANGSPKGSSGKSGETESNRSKDDDEPRSGRAEREQYSGRGELLQHATNANSERWLKQSANTITNEPGQLSGIFQKAGFKSWPTQSPICNGNDGFSSRLDGITFSKWRNESIKAGGNAIVPQVALQIFKAIQQYEKTIIN